MLAGEVLMGLAWLISNHYAPWNSFYNEAAMLVGLLLLALAAPWHGVPRVAAAVLAVALVPSLQWTFGLLVFSGDVWVSVLYLLALAIAVSTGYALARGDVRSVAMQLSVTAVVAGLASSVIAMTQCLQTAQWGIWAISTITEGRAVANLAQPNNLATVMAFAVLGVCLLFEQRRIGAVGSLSLLVPLLLGLALTQSRTAFLFGPALLALRYVAPRPATPWRTPIAALFAISALQVALALAWPSASTALLLTEVLTVTERGAGSGRVEAWRVFIGALSQSPWVGYGWLQAGAAQLAAAERFPIGTHLFLQTHNLFVDILVWCGWPLGIGLCAMCLTWYVSRCRGAKSPESIVGMMVVTVFGVHAMLELPHHYVYLLVPVGLWMGVVESERGSPGMPWRLAQRGVLCGTAALGVALAWHYPAVEADFRLMRFEVLRIGTVRASQPAPHAPFLSSLTEYLRFTRTPIHAGMGESELKRMADIVTRYPYVQSMYRLAVARALNGQLNEAQRELLRLRHVHGDAEYRHLRFDLRRRAADGEPELAALSAALPD